MASRRDDGVTTAFIERFHSRDQLSFLSYERKEKSSTPTGFVWNTNMAAVSLFWNTNMAAVTSCENALLLPALYDR